MSAPAGEPAPVPGAPPLSSPTSPSSPPFVANRVFVTSAAYGGDLKAAGDWADGFSGADNLCGHHAAAVGLGDAFRAYLSAGMRARSSRPPRASAVPALLADGRVAFPDASEIVLAPRLPIAVTEK